MRPNLMDIINYSSAVGPRVQFKNSGPNSGQVWSGWSGSFGRNNFFILTHKTQQSKIATNKIKMYSPSFKIAVLLNCASESRLLSKSSWFLWCRSSKILISFAISLRSSCNSKRFRIYGIQQRPILYRCNKMTWIKWCSSTEVMLMCTLRSVNDVTEGITQESTMGAS